LPQERRGRGLICPRCGCINFAGSPSEVWSVTHTQPRRGYIRRRRVCRNCGHAIFTRERVEG